MTDLITGTDRKDNMDSLSVSQAESIYNSITRNSRSFNKDSVRQKFKRSLKAPRSPVVGSRASSNSPARTPQAERSQASSSFSTKRGRPGQVNIPFKLPKAPKDDRLNNQADNTSAFTSGSGSIMIEDQDTINDVYELQLDVCTPQGTPKATRKKFLVRQEALAPEDRPRKPVIRNPSVNFGHSSFTEVTKLDDLESPFTSVNEFMTDSERTLNDNSLYLAPNLRKNKDVRPSNADINSLRSGSSASKPSTRFHTHNSKKVRASSLKLKVHQNARGPQVSRSHANQTQSFKRNVNHY